MNKDGNLSYKFYLAKPKTNTKFICKCKLGSPKPGLVIIDATLHESGCSIRRNIIRNTRNTKVTPDQWHDGVSLGVATTN
jgi:hypothetical protein